MCRSLFLAFRWTHLDFESLYQQNPRPVKAGGEAYKDFSETLSVRDNVEYDPNSTLHVSFDFNVNPYLPVGIFQVKGYEFLDPITGKLIKEFEVFKIKEFTMVTPLNTTRAACQMVAKEYDNHRAGMHIYGDPNGFKEDTRSEKGHNDFTIIKQELRKFNPRLNIFSVAPSVKMRIEFMNNLFAGNIGGLKYFIDSRCTVTIDDYRYLKEAPDGTKFKEKMIDRMTGRTAERYGHMTDLDEYFICHLFNKAYQFYIRGGISAPIKQVLRQSRHSAMIGSNRRVNSY